MAKQLRFSFQETENGSGIQVLYGGEDHYQNETPVILKIKEAAGCLRTYECGYDKVSGAAPDLFRCEAKVCTVNNSEFYFVDKIAIDCKKQEIRVAREVDVRKPSALDVGFSTEFGLKKGKTEKEKFSDRFEVFVPGSWYRHNDGVVKHAFASDMFQKDYYLRITRMALPYIQLCDIKTGGYISICHTGKPPQTDVLEKSADWVVDSSLQYASLGISAEEETIIKYIYPGSEGETSYLEPSGGWAGRAHPVRSGVTHQYQITVHFGEGRDCYERMRREWRHWYAHFRPEVYSCDLEKVYEDGVNLIDTYCQEYNGVMGLPFWVMVPGGNVSDISFQMGFVGQQTQCAYHLIRHGIRRKIPHMVEKGKKIIDFWVTNSMKESYLPQVWYDVFPPKFREDYPTYLRTAADGMEGILTAFLYLKRHGEVKEEWFDFCRRFGDRLGEVQGEDGSFARAYGRDGRAVHKGKYNTSNVIRFLINLYFAAGEKRYRDIAVRAGEFCYGYIYKKMCYIGGTADNDNTIDKEAGMQALYAFLALYDLTGENKWIEAARGAADFCETWTYSWTFPIKPCKGNAVFHEVNQTGLSLIATGHSHCDVMMGYCPFDYYRLYLLTGDEHYMEFAEMILCNTKQTTDWDGKHGHAYPGLVEESGEIALQYHNGLGKWLPWCTIAEIETLSRLEEWFGSMELRRGGNVSEYFNINSNLSQFFKV